MMNQTYDCIVVGVGGFGSSALYHLARHGLRVLGIDRFGIAHDHGSSHGETRIIRKAYFEHPDYVPLLLSAYDLWDDLESEFRTLPTTTESSLCRLCGLMLAGRADGEAITGALLSAKLHGLRIDRLASGEAGSRFQGFKFPDDYSVVFEADAGYLHVERCVRAHIECALARGATLNTDESVIDWSSDGNTVRVTTDRASYEAAQLIITPGAWAGQLVNGLPLSLRVLRKLVFWHEVRAEHYDVESGAVAFYFEMPSGIFYGFPSLDARTVKLAEHSGGKDVDDPLTLDREAHDDDIRPVSDFIEAAMPGLNPRPLRHSACMYTFTKDSHFVVDRHPEFPNVFVGAGFSGHGFKFTGVIGKALADLIAEGQTSHEIKFLGLDRESLQ